MPAYDAATALIVVDLQNDFADPAGGLSVKGGDEIVPVVNAEIAAAAAGGALIAFGLSSNLWLSLAVLPFAGFGMMQQMASSNTILQTIVDDDKRGRVMAFYAMAFMGMTPFGSLVAGSLAAHFGAPLTTALGGSLCLAGSLWFQRELPEIRALVRPIYTKLGILPEVAAGLQQACSPEPPVG